jgi:hypothetical protein
MLAVDQQDHLFGLAAEQVQVLGITWTTTVKVMDQLQAAVAVLDIFKPAH